MTNLVDTKKTAEILGISENTLKKYRMVGGGPIFHKFGRSVRYDLDDIAEYRRGNRYDNTCLLYTSPSPRDQRGSRMPSSA